VDILGYNFLKKLPVDLFFVQIKRKKGVLLGLVFWSIIKILTIFCGSSLKRGAICSFLPLLFIF
jgi:hypothetical protein